MKVVNQGVKDFAERCVGHMRSYEVSEQGMSSIHLAVLASRSAAFQASMAAFLFL